MLRCKRHGCLPNAKGRPSKFYLDCTPGGNRKEGTELARRFNCRCIAIPLSKCTLMIILLSQPLSCSAPGAGCPVSSYGRTGDKLLLVRAAVDRANADFGSAVHNQYGFVASDFHLKAAEVILIDHMDRFLHCRGIFTADVRQTLKFERVAFVIGHRLPIYINGQLNRVSLAVRLFSSNAHLSFTFAHVLAHEWIHAILSSDSEIEPYRIEVVLLEKWMAENPPLKPLLQIEVDSVKSLLQEARRTEGVQP